MADTWSESSEEAVAEMVEGYRPPKRSRRGGKAAQRKKRRDERIREEALAARSQAAPKRKAEAAARTGAPATTRAPASSSSSSAARRVKMASDVVAPWKKGERHTTVGVQTPAHFARAFLPKRKNEDITETRTVSPTPPSASSLPAISPIAPSPAQGSMEEMVLNMLMKAAQEGTLQTPEAKAFVRSMLSPEAKAFAAAAVAPLDAITTPVLPTTTATPVLPPATAEAPQTVSKTAAVTEAEASQRGIATTAVMTTDLPAGFPVRPPGMPSMVPQLKPAYGTPVHSAALAEAPKVPKKASYAEVVKKPVLKKRPRSEDEDEGRLELLPEDNPSLIEEVRRRAEKRPILCVDYHNVLDTSTLGICSEYVPSQNIGVMAKLCEQYTVVVLSYIGVRGTESQKRRQDIRRAVSEMNALLSKKVGPDDDLPLLKVVDKPTGPHGKVAWMQSVNATTLMDDSPDIVKEAWLNGIRVLPIDLPWKVQTWPKKAGLNEPIQSWMNFVAAGEHLLEHAHRERQLDTGSRGSRWTPKHKKVRRGKAKETEA